MESQSEINQQNEKPFKPFYYGFGGWLYVFAGGLAFQFYGNVTTMYDNINLLKSDYFKQLTDPYSDSYNSFWYPSIIAEIILELVLMLNILLIAYFCIKLSKKFKSFSLLFISASLLFQVFDLFLMLTIQNGYSEPIYDNKTLYSGIERSFVYAVIWIPYFLVSKRVKNTFIK